MPSITALILSATGRPRRADTAEPETFLTRNATTCVHGKGGGTMTRRIIFIAILLAGTVAGAQAQTTSDDLRTWETVGSAGTVDEADLSKVTLDHAIAQIGLVISAPPTTAAKTAAIGQTTSAVIRYNVVPVDGFFAPRVAAPN